MSPSYYSRPTDWLRFVGAKALTAVVAGGVAAAWLPAQWRQWGFSVYFVTTCIVYALVSYIQALQMLAWLGQGIKEGKRLMFGASSRELLDYQSIYGHALVISHKYLWSTAKLVSARVQLIRVMDYLPDPDLDGPAHKV